MPMGYSNSEYLSDQQRLNEENLRKYEQKEQERKYEEEERKRIQIERFNNPVARFEDYCKEYGSLISDSKYHPSFSFRALEELEHKLQGFLQKINYENWEEQFLKDNRDKVDGLVRDVIKRLQEVEKKLPRAQLNDLVNQYNNIVASVKIDTVSTFQLTEELRKIESLEQAFNAINWSAWFLAEARNNIEELAGNIKKLHAYIIIMLPKSKLRKFDIQLDRLEQQSKELIFEMKDFKQSDMILTEITTDYNKENKRDHFSDCQPADILCTQSKLENIRKLFDSRSESMKFILANLPPKEPKGNNKREEKKGEAKKWRLDGDSTKVVMKFFTLNEQAKLRAINKFFCQEIGSTRVTGIIFLAQTKPQLFFNFKDNPNSVVTFNCLGKTTKKMFPRSWFFKKFNDYNDLEYARYYFIDTLRKDYEKIEQEKNKKNKENSEGETSDAINKPPVVVTWKRL